MKAYEFVAPGKILFGAGIAARVGEEAARFGKKALLVTGKTSAARTGALDKMQAYLANADVDAVVFDQVEADPSSATVEKGVALYRQMGCEVIVALGGGSPLDAAKAIGLLATNSGRVQDYEGKAIPRPIAPMIALPTTAGTGSEVSRFTVITDRERKVKMLLGSPSLVPAVAILDPELTYTMPPSVTAATGMDALTHAIEAYISKKATPMTDLHALEAIGELSAHVVKATLDPASVRARAAMMHGQMLAGLAFSNASTCLVHSMSRPMGARFGVPHGVANAMLLPSVMEYNRPACVERLAEVARYMEPDASNISDRDASMLAVELLREILENTGLPTTLSEVGITPDDVEELAKDAFASPSTQLNPRRPTLAEVEALFEALL